MSDNTKEGISPADTSSASLSADMSMLDELFPSLGNGESSANHFTNQLALLLNNLGSSDDEGSNGPNLFNPLQLSPPRLNEIHALATANLISQTQEAIMQEYNITDFDFERSTHSDIAENEEIVNNEMSFQDDGQICNTNEINELGANTIGSATQDLNSTPCSVVENANKTKNCFKSESQTLSSLYMVGHKTVADHITITEDLNNDKKHLTKVKIRSCDESTLVEKVGKDNFEVLKQENGPHSRTQIISDQDLETQSAINNIIDTGSAVQNENVIKTASTNCSVIDRNKTNEDLYFYSSSNRPTSVERSPQKLLLKRSLEISDVNSNTYTEHKDRNTDIKRSHEVLNCLLPPKKRHLECNAVAYVDTNSQFENKTKNVYCNNLQKETKAKGTVVVPSETGSKENEKASSTEKGVLYVCVICMKQFSNVYDLEVHSTNHLKYVCPHPGCVRTFTYRSHLSYHRQTHEGQKNYQCSECGKVFVKAQHLDVHMLTHQEAKPFICDVCSKSFTTAGNLKNHSRTHSGERPYACDINGCTKSFAELSSLKKHKVTHTGEKSFKCDVCGKGFTQASSRSYHMKKHKGKL